MRLPDGLLLDTAHAGFGSSEHREETPQFSQSLHEKCLLECIQVSAEKQMIFEVPTSWFVERLNYYNLGGGHFQKSITAHFWHRLPWPDLNRLNWSEFNVIRKKYHLEKKYAPKCIGVTNQVWRY